MYLYKVIEQYSDRAMLSCISCCQNASSVKVADASKNDSNSNSRSGRKSKKLEIICVRCSANKNILTLNCKHKYCVKCYNKEKYCKECEKNKSKFRFGFGCC